jgi:hypothetical protein
LTLKVPFQYPYQVVGYNAQNDRGDRYFVADLRVTRGDGATFLFILFIFYLGYYLLISKQNKKQ